MTLSDWEGDKLIKLMEQTVDTKMQVVGKLLVNELKAELVQHDNSAGTDPSAPGEPPAKVSGTLSGSVTSNYDPKTQTLKVGTPKMYGKWLEEGTRFMAMRPWLRPIFRKNKAKIGKIFKGS